MHFGHLRTAALNQSTQAAESSAIGTSPILGLIPHPSKEIETLDF